MDFTPPPCKRNFPGTESQVLPALNSRTSKLKELGPFESFDIAGPFLVLGCWTELDSIMLAINVQAYIMLWFISLYQHVSTEEHYYCISYPQNVVQCRKSSHSSHPLEYKENYFWCLAPSMLINCNIGAIYNLCSYFDQNLILINLCANIALNDGQENKKINMKNQIFHKSHPKSSL